MFFVPLLQPFLPYYTHNLNFLLYLYMLNLTLLKKTAFVLFSLFATISVSAQEVVYIPGDSYSNTRGSVDFTIGEVAINTGTDGTNDLTQGFHQTNWNFLGVEDHVPNYEAIIFPNPTEDLLNIRTSTFENVTTPLNFGRSRLLDYVLAFVSFENYFFLCGLFFISFSLVKLNNTIIYLFLL
jgi:hypothetical protein